MHMQVIRCIKAFCDDFQPIRQILTSLGATYVEQTEQVDYFFLLPRQLNPSSSRRLKLRIKNDQPRWIYCYDRNQDGSSMVTFRRCEVRDPNIKDVLAAALGVDVVTRKNREVWRADDAIFNLDRLYGVGQIFEVELEVDEQNRYVEQRKHYERLFRPCLGIEIQGSNEDLIRSQPVRR
jgi:adenylate cyclase class IV